MEGGGAWWNYLNEGIDMTPHMLKVPAHIVLARRTYPSVILPLVIQFIQPDIDLLRTHDGIRNPICPFSHIHG